MGIKRLKSTSAFNTRQKQYMQSLVEHAICATRHKLETSKTSFNFSCNLRQMSVYYGPANKLSLYVLSDMSKSNCDGLCCLVRLLILTYYMPNVHSEDIFIDIILQPRVGIKTIQHLIL